MDILVFTAATNVRKRLVDYTDEEFDRVVDLNLRASFDLVRAFGAGMAERGRGSIIGFASIRAVTVEPGQGVYAATKAGLVQLLRTAAAELGPSGVRVNAVAPGVVETPLTAQIRADAGVVRRVRRARARSAGGRGRTSSPARWPTWSPTRRASSPGRCCSSTAGGRPSTAATSRPPEPRPGRSLSPVPGG